MSLLKKILVDFGLLMGFSDINGPTIRDKANYEQFTKYCEKNELYHDMDALKLREMNEAHMRSL